MCVCVCVVLQILHCISLEEHPIKLWKKKQKQKQNDNNKRFFQTPFFHKLRRIIIKSHETTYLMPRMLEIKCISKDLCLVHDRSEGEFKAPFSLPEI